MPRSQAAPRPTSDTRPSKLHLSADGRCRPLSLVVTPGQLADCTPLKPVLEKIRVARPGPTPARPDSIAADKAYSNGPCREYLRRRASGTRTRRRPTAEPPAYAKAHAVVGHPASTKGATSNATPLNGRSTA
ncbi:transposase [Streptomyces sp. NPDC001939]